MTKEQADILSEYLLNNTVLFPNKKEDNFTFNIDVLDDGRFIDTCYYILNEECENITESYIIIVDNEKIELNVNFKTNNPLPIYDLDFDTRFKYVNGVKDYFSKYILIHSNNIKLSDKDFSMLNIKNNINKLNYLKYKYNKEFDKIPEIDVEKEKAEELKLRKFVDYLGITPEIKKNINKR